jgi:hypothetical protein
MNRNQALLKAQTLRLQLEAMQTLLHDDIITACHNCRSLFTRMTDRAHTHAADLCLLLTGQEPSNGKGGKTP